MLRYFMVLFSLVIASCGQQEFPDYKNEDFVFYEESEGTYSGDIIFLKRPTRRMKIEPLVWIKGNQFYVKIFVQSGPPESRFQQYIHKGSRCPQKSDDLNGDGFIDMSEVILASGEILIPLDGYIQNQKKGSHWFPVTNRNGMYYYSKAASVSKMMKDLYARDKSPKDGISKLRKGEPLDIERRILMIYGTKNDPLMPVACIRLTPKGW